MSGDDSELSQLLETLGLHKGADRQARVHALSDGELIDALARLSDPRLFNVTPDVVIDLLSEAEARGLHSTSRH